MLTLPGVPLPPCLPAALQDELQMRGSGEGEWIEGDEMGEQFGFEEAAAVAASDSAMLMLPALGPAPLVGEPQQQRRRRQRQRQGRQRGTQPPQQREAQQQQRHNQQPGQGQQQPAVETPPAPGSGLAPAAPPGPAAEAAAAAGPSADAQKAAQPAAAPARTAAAAGRTAQDPDNGSSAGAAHSTGPHDNGSDGLRLRRGLSPFKFSRCGSAPLACEVLSRYVRMGHLGAEQSHPTPTPRR